MFLLIAPNSSNSNFICFDKSQRVPIQKITPTLPDNGLCLSFIFEVLLAYSKSNCFIPSCARFSLEVRFQSKHIKNK